MSIGEANVYPYSADDLGPRDLALVEQTVRATLRSLDEQVLPVRKEWLRPKEAAEFLGLHPIHLAKLRSKGGGPLFHAIGSRLVRYHVDDLSRWVRGGGGRVGHEELGPAAVLNTTEK